MSPQLFGLYTEELAERLRRTGKGINISGNCLNLLMYADDIVILSESKEDLQSLLDLVAGFGRDLKFSDEKNQVLVINGDDSDVGRTWKLGEMTLKRTKKYQYFGMLVDEKGCEDTKCDRLSRANQWVGRLGSAAKTRANKYEVVRGVWKGMAVPSLMYGLETMRWTKNDWGKLEVTQNKVDRIALGANRYAATETLRGEVGLSSFAERITKGVLRYKVRLQKMDGNRWARLVYEWSRTGSKWNRMCEKMIDECQMRREVTFDN